jgi:hypothetical protein
MKKTYLSPFTGLAAGVLMAAALGAHAASAPPITGQIVFRPLTPGDVTAYSLSSTLENSGGLDTVGVMAPIYLEVNVGTNIAASTITNVAWSVTTYPVGASITLSNSPLGANVPVYEPSERLIYNAAGRAVLRVNMAGQYVVQATVYTAGSGSTNWTKKFTAGTYLGASICALCHSGGQLSSNMYSAWQVTKHATIFTKLIDGAYPGNTSPYRITCIKCHTVGYDTMAGVTNGGFDDVMSQLGWTFPTVSTNGNWAAMPGQLQALANIQCENCHGPGSEHAYALGNTNLSNWPRITKSMMSGDCNQCHDAPTHHIYGTEWLASGHANTTRTPSGTASRIACVQCHTSYGFIQKMDKSTATTNVTYGAIGCQACHEPHGQGLPTNSVHQLRGTLTPTLPDGTVVANAGTGGFCMNCHYSRNGSAVTNVINYAAGLYTWVGGSSFGVHDSPQGDMLMGVNAIDYGKSIASSAHRFAISNTCVGCHMQSVAISDPAFLKAGGHTTQMSYVNTNGVTVDLVAVCQQCHGPITNFDFAKVDYNGDGVIEGVQTEVQKLLNTLSSLLPKSNWVVGGVTNYYFDGLAKSPSTKTNWSQSFLKAAYNWQFVNADGSLGVHNAQYAVGLLKASITDLTGDPSAKALSANDMAYYGWAVNWFGSAADPRAAQSATPAGDGIPNWLKYSLGVNPLVAGMTNAMGGIVYANGTSLGGNNSTNTVRIYTAAEVTFNTQTNVTYQLQATSSLSGGWQNVGNPIVGTGTSFSYLTATRTNVQQYFRVSHTP